MYRKRLKGRHFWKHSNNVAKSVTYMLLLLREWNERRREGQGERESMCEHAYTKGGRQGSHAKTNALL